jgi:hypothetical protein
MDNGLQEAATGVSTSASSYFLLTVLIPHLGNGPGWFVAVPYSYSGQSFIPANTLSPRGQTAPRASFLSKEPFLILTNLYASSTSPFWRPNSNSSPSYDNKKIIGASYSHADILKFDSLYARLL